MTMAPFFKVLGCLVRSFSIHLRCRPSVLACCFFVLFGGVCSGQDAAEEHVRDVRGEGLYPGRDKPACGDAGGEGFVWLGFCSRCDGVSVDAAVEFQTDVDVSLDVAVDVDVGVDLDFVCCCYC